MIILKYLNSKYPVPHFLTQINGTLFGILETLLILRLINYVLIL